MNIQIFRYGVLIIGLAAVLLVYTGCNKIEEVSKVFSGKEKYYFYSLPAAVFLTAVYMIFMYTLETDQLMSWKRIAFLPLLWYIAYVDYREKLILNEFIIMGLGLRGLLFIPEFLLGGSQCLTIVMTEVAGGVIMFLFGILFRFLSRNGLGYGDIKLFSIVPLYMGFLGGFRSIMYGMLLIFVVSCIFLIIKRKGLKDELPFAPAIALGCWITMFVSCV